ncbi:MAG: SGNH/GDSL hydrolase family protein [Leptospiraceae bacterium]|nr:SGNH/GDSL hydrolase family protein [Leptospiraceae bacterium]
MNLIKNFICLSILTLIITCSSTEKPTTTNMTRVNFIGDSWLSYPVSKDLTDELVNLFPKNDKILVENLAKAGRKIDQQLVLVPNTKPDIFIVSIGGNDIYDWNHLIKVGAESDITKREQKIDENVKLVKTKWMKLIQEIRSKSKTNTLILTMGYDYPNLGGDTSNCPILQKLFAECKHISKPLNTRATKKLTQEEIRKVGNDIMDKFNQSMNEISTNKEYKNNLIYIDLRKSLTDKDFLDEIHPSQAGFQILATKFLKKVCENKNNSELAICEGK